MKSYMYEPMWTQQMEDVIERGYLSQTKSLIEEMFYKYGLKVYDLDERSERAYMTLDGLPYCDVGAEYNSEGGITYFYHSVFYAKERGRSSEDRQTFYSNKLSSLMKVLEKKKAVAASTEEALCFNLSGSIINQLERNIKNTNKSAWEMDTNHMHELLKAYFGEIDRTSVSQESIVHCKSVLDQYNKADDNKRQRQERIDSFVGNGMYVIGRDAGDGYIVGKISVGKDSNRTTTVVEDAFHRVRSLEESPLISNLSGAIPMIKVYFEQRSGEFSFRGDEGSFKLPVTDRYFEDIDVCTTYKTSVSRYTQIWMAIPA